MIIIQMSDFHLTDTTDKDIAIKKIDLLMNSIKDEYKNIDRNEELVFCICGDIIDKGDSKGYKKAKDIFDHLQSEIKKNHNKVFFEFVPGNHDLIRKNFKKFDTFISPYLNKGKNSYEYQKDSIILTEYEKLNLILINSVSHKEKKYGSIDIERLQQVLSKSNKPTILITHHTLSSRYDKDFSAVTNAYSLINTINKSNVIALLHGHTHGYSNLTFGDKCKVIGVGPMFKHIEDINNQVNAVKINNNNEIESIKNYWYRADGEEAKFESKNLYKKTYPNHYNGSSIYKLYLKIVNDVEQVELINNLTLNLNEEIDVFFEDIEKNFKNEIEVAKQWIEEKNPITLYYNHEKYINYNNNDGLGHIIKELNRKPTSCRAIIPLIHLNEVIDSGDNFLPSLDIIQFGFNTEAKDKLYMTLYLRALEVKNFLKINLCEVYHLCKALKKEINNIESLNLTIISFKAQIKENFSCFQKADIDKLDEIDLSNIVRDKDIDKIISLLDNKNKLSETVIMDGGIKNLCKALLKCSKSSGNSTYPDYPDDLIKKTQELSDELSKLKNLRKTTSIYKKIESEEKKITSKIKTLITILKQIDTKQL